MTGAAEAMKPILARLAGHGDGAPPVWLMRQAGRYLPEYREVRAAARDFLDFCYRPELAVEVTLQPIRRFGLDAAILFSDILVVPDALGWGVRFVEGEGPRLDPFRSVADLDRLDPTRLPSHLAPVYETLRRLRHELPEQVALIGFAGAPWTLAAYMIEGGGSKDYQTARSFARTERALMAALIDRLTDAVADHLEAQIAAGAEVVQLFDSWAGVLAPQERRAWSLEPCARIAARLRRSHPDIPLILFPRGVGAGYLDYAHAAGVQALGLDTTVPMGWAAQSLRGPALRCLQGNLDPLALLGPEAALLEEARGIVAAATGRPHIFNLGHGVVPQTPPQAVAVLVRYLQSLRG
jgi:uroporphyrinogen decarboxylase